MRTRPSPRTGRSVPDRRPRPAPTLATAGVGSSRPRGESAPQPSTDRRPPRPRAAASLYDPRFEHDACGVGFVADAGGRSRGRVLRLALAGLASLGHRGAFAADGESSDGAGVAFPLEPSVLERLAPGLVRPGIVVAFLPRRPVPARRGRRLVEEALAANGLTLAGWRGVPVDPSALGSEAAATRPTIEQALVERPAGLGDADFEARLALARRRAETTARAEGLEEFAIPSASCRSVVYKGLVAGSRLADFYADLAAPLAVRYAVFHQRYATNTHPVWRLAQPFRYISHNGEINTVRGNREQVRGRIGDRRGSVLARRLVEAGPLLSPDASDSLSLDEAIELLVLTGWRVETAMLAAIPEAQGLRRSPHPGLAAFARRVAGFLAPWDGPGAFVFADGRRVGALVDRNGLRPAAFAVTGDGLVALASEAGAVPLDEARIVRRGRLGPGEMLLVDPGRGLVLEDAEAKAEALRPVAVIDEPASDLRGRRDPAAPRPIGTRTPLPLRYLAGLDAEKARLDIRTMALEAKEPLWSMGDDTPLAGLGRVDRPVSDHLRQAFAQVTNPAIDPEREQVVMDLSVQLGRRAPLLGGPPDDRRAGRRRAWSRTLRLERPIVTDRAELVGALEADGRSVRVLDATWDPKQGEEGLRTALERLAEVAVVAARAGTEVLVSTDRAFGLERLPIPSVLAVGAIHTALTEAGLRGRTDLVAEAADVLDVHGLAMVLASGATVVCPWLAVELATELAGGRGAEDRSPEELVGNLVAAFSAGLRKTLARMGISTVASYVGGALFEVLELDAEVLARCFPGAPAWPGMVGFDDLARRQLRRLEAARAIPADDPRAKLVDPGLARFRGDGELHLYAPSVVGELQAVARTSDEIEAALARLRAVREHPAAVVRDGLRLRRSRQPVPLEEVEPARSIVRRFVASAMSVGALSPEAHQAITIGIQRAGGAANTGEGGEDPAWYVPGPDGERHDARIKQVASARFGVTSQYLARADQIEIKIAQGSKPGEGGQLPGKKATAYIAALRRAQPGQSLISPPPHHDIYSIEDLAQLIADLRSINPWARIGVKLVATRGVGTIAAGVAKAGADYIHIAGHAGGTGASPLSSIKHVGVPWELGLAETHETLLRNDLRDRVVLRTDGGLQTGRDLLIAALLGAEEFGFGTAMLVAIGCDMARQCHLDTCPTGIATQREDLRAKFTGTPEQVERFVLAVAEDLRRELAAIGARSVGEIVGEARRYLRAATTGRTLDVRGLLGLPRWSADAARRADPERAREVVERPPASPLERRLVEELRAGGVRVRDGLAMTTAERSFGAELSGAMERGEIDARDGLIRLELRGSAGQSFGAFTCAGVTLTLIGEANDYVGKGLGGGTIVLRPAALDPAAESAAEVDDVAADGSSAVAGGVIAAAPSQRLAHRPEAQAIAGNVCLYGATAGRLHVVGRAGMRFAIRNSGAEAVVEGVGPHGCEYMTGGTVVVLGPIGGNFGAGMTGGRAFLYDPAGRHASLLHSQSVGATRLATAVHERSDGAALVADLRRLLEAHAAAGSPTAARLLADGALPLGDFWLVEPVGAVAGAAAAEPARSAAGGN